MLASQRHRRITEEIQRSGTARVVSLAQSLGVSEMTIRRDLDVLEDAGVLEKVHGGAIATSHNASFEPGFERKLLRETGPKNAIAQAAVRHIKPGAAIALTAGTTTWTMVNHLANIANLTVVTNSPTVAQSLYSTLSSDSTVLLTGGVKTPSYALIGPLAVGSLRSLSVDIVFMGIHGMTQRSGFTTPNLGEAEINQTFIDIADRVVVVADHTKWGTSGLACIAPLRAADILVSDEQLPADARSALTDAGVTLDIATSHLTDTTRRQASS